MTTTSIPKICKLCRKQVEKLVDSHIIPRAFYEELGKLELVDKSKHSHDVIYKKGVYGNFLCLSCESKFKLVDERAIQVLKKGSKTVLVHSADLHAANIVENAFENRKNLHEFALSVLWRAAASGRVEFKGIELGSYAEKLREAFLSAAINQELLEVTGLLFQEYRGGKSEARNQSFIPYRLFNKGADFKESFGNFDCHVFGFPYGELFVRLGGETPNQGYFDLQFPCFNGKAVLWTCNLSASYPHWFFNRKPNDQIHALFRQVNAQPNLAFHTDKF
jgi:hypothetical protein